MTNSETITLLAVGDVCVNREDPDSIFAYVAPTIQSADISFCQLETTFSDRGTHLPTARKELRVHPRNAPSINRAGFGVVSFASNHVMDWGEDAFFDTIEVMRKTGINLLGVGGNMEEARRPHVIDCKGTRVAFLAYNSILPPGYWAEEHRPGCVPMRAYTFYEQVEPQPGTPPKIHTFAYKGDKEAMVEDIGKARSQADIVVVSQHWGIHFREAEIAMYQQEVGYEALDAGADVVLGHHAHILKPIEIYKGKPIFHSLGNFAFDFLLPEEVLVSSQWKERVLRLNPKWKHDPNYRAYPFGVEARMTMACEIAIQDKKLREVAFLPALINENSQPRFLSSSEKEFHDVVRYMRKIQKSQKIGTKFHIEDDKVIVVT